MATTEPLLVDTDLVKRLRLARAFPTCERIRFCASHRTPAQCVLRRDMRERHRVGVERKMMLETPRLTLLRLRPRQSAPE